MRLPPPLDRVPPPQRPWVFAVEPDAVQITWRAGTFTPGRVRFAAAGTAVVVEADQRPGVVTLDGLPADTKLTVHVEGPGVPRPWRRLRTATLPHPPGDELFRFATVSDLHIGQRTFGFRDTMVEVPEPEVLHPVRAARAAFGELAAWGAQLLLVKGDLTHGGQRRHWDQVAELLAGCPVPVELLPGNHDTWPNKDWLDPWEALTHLGHEMTRHRKVLDVPGLRLVLIDSCIPGRNTGRVAHATADVVADVRSAGTPAFVTMHHYAQRLPVPTFWPPGIPSGEANAFMAAVGEANPATFVSSGHTHRHRRRHVGPLVWTEVGSPKDYPGTWAGYVVHEGGIRQVVRRVADPGLLPWLDYSAQAGLHLWGRWSPGLLHHRCFTHSWPTR